MKSLWMKHSSHQFRRKCLDVFQNKVKQCVLSKQKTVFEPEGFRLMNEQTFNRTDLVDKWLLP